MKICCIYLNEGCSSNKHVEHKQLTNFSNGFKEILNVVFMLLSWDSIRAVMSKIQKSMVI